jgi:Ca-activated chloride channel family protein
VLLATDGAALAGDAAPAAEAAVARWRGLGVSLLVVGCADEQYDGAALERLAQQGDGEHLVAASDQQARELFSGRLLPARLAILARDAKAQVTWNPERVAHARLIGFEQRRLSHEQFRDNTVDAGELAQDAQATALFEIVLHDRGSGQLGTAAVRYHDTRLDRVVELSRQLPGGLVAATASPRLRLFACAAELGEQMQAGWWRNVRGPSDRLATELARLDAPFAQVLAGMERRYSDLERQDAKP